MKSISVLGIHDGTIVSAVSEERLTRRKNEVGYPAKSIVEVLRIGGVDPLDLSAVVYASNFMHREDYLSNIDAWYKVGLAEQRAAEAQPKDYKRVIFGQRRDERIAQAVKQLGVPAAKVSFVEHHLAHLAAAYYTAPNRKPGRPVLGITCDGAGDGLCATASICDGNAIDRIAETSRHASLGKIYSRVTFLMGMTPWEHEYKLMGLAPYADPQRAQAAARPLHRLLKLSDDGLRFEQASELSTNYCYEFLRDVFERVRFDTICGALQHFTEEMLLDWVRGCVRRTGISDVVAGGGVFMNVKANMLIAQMPEVSSFYVMPSCADESLSIGAALHRYYQDSGVTDHAPSRLANLYLGGGYDLGEEEVAIAVGRKSADLEVRQPNDMGAAVAGLLADGEIVATCRGRMEWGARALGNRSILSSADNYARVDVINRMIKMRDFWMPFAPAVKAEAANRYFDDPKDLKPWFMTFAYPAKQGRYGDLAAGSHPRDCTIRPQLVTQQANSDFHAVIEKFEEKTGRGAILNTSFNLHGEPIVYSPADAMRVLLESGLKHLALDHYVVSKKAA
jgi:carbamoyltransferase